MQQLEKRYGLLTAICMIVGTVIGSGVFFKAQNVLIATNGNMYEGIAAWLISGALMIICSLQFALIATHYKKAHGVIDYADALMGKKYAYYVGWFLATIYYPAMTGVLTWVSARYFGVLVGWDLASSEVMALSGFLLISFYTLNAFSPKLAGKFQVSATFIKFIPIVLMATVGTLIGTFNGTLATNFTQTIEVTKQTGGLFAAIVATIFAYEGWIVATSISDELKDAEKNLPIALVCGSVIVVLAYVLYYIGTAAGANTLELMEKGATYSVTNIFGEVGGMILNIFIFISCLGTLNGLMVAETRAMYTLAIKNEQVSFDIFRQVDDKTNMVTNSSIFGLFISAFWFLYFFGANLVENPWFGVFSFDSSELPIITVYAMYIPLFIRWIKTNQKASVYKRFIIPIIAIIGCTAVVLITIYAHGIVPYLNAKAEGLFAFPVLFYLVIFVLFMLVGKHFYEK